MAETFAQFSSPAKRRKMSTLAEDASGGLCSPDPKAAASRLKGHKTPAKHFQSSLDMPSTPGSELQADSGIADGLLTASPEQLPGNLMLLHQLLGALYVTMPLVKSRGKSTTYQNLRVPVQNFTGRDFQIKHIQQIKALCPAALGWEHILANNTVNGKQEQQLLLKMPATSSSAKQSVETAQMQQLFFQRLQKHMQKHQASSAAEPPLPMAELPPFAGPNARDCTPNRRPINLDLLPGTPQTAPPAGLLPRTGGDGITTNQLALMSPPPKRAATARKPAMDALMSPPPGRTRGAKGKQAAGKEGEGSHSSFTFSPMCSQPDMLLSPRGGAGPVRPLGMFASASTRHHTPVRDRAAETEGSAVGSVTPAAGLRPNKLFGTPMATATPQQASTSRRPTDMHATPPPAAEDAAAEMQPPASSVVKVRKLSFDSAVKEPAAPAPAAAAAAAAAAAKAKKKCGKPGGITFELGGNALALLEKVTSAEAQRGKAVRQKELDQQRALDMLPGTFDVMRAVYGDKGPCVKPKSELLVLLRQKSTSKAGMSPSDAAGQLELLMRFVPEFVRTINTPGQSLAGMTQSVRINRQMSWPAARQKLLAAAAEARSSGIAAAARALAAEEQREKQEAAAAAGAEGDEQQEIESEEEVVNGEAVELVAAADAVADEVNALDQTGLAILAQLGGGSSINGGKADNSAAPGGLNDEVLLLLGGGVGSCSSSGAKHNAKGADEGDVTDALLSCLAFKAPARKPM